MQPTKYKLLSESVGPSGFAHLERATFAVNSLKGRCDATSLSRLQGPDLPGWCRLLGAESHTNPGASPVSRLSICLRLIEWELFVIREPSLILQARQSAKNCE